MSIIPDNNVAGKSKINRSFLETDEWKAAKELSDKAAADRVVDELWSDKKTSDLKSYFQDPSNVVFITVPSTSRRNAIPISLAERLSKDFNAKYFSGNELFIPVHGQQSKHIPRLQRPFNRREYVPDNIEDFKKECAGKNVIVADDILTTGGSVAAFCSSLNDNGVEVKSVAALIGDKRLNIDLKTKAHLEATLKNAGLSFDSEALSARLTRAEAGGLIMQINSARSENAKQKIAGNLHGLLDQRPFKDMGRDTATGRHEGPQGKDHSNGQVTEKVSPWPVRPEPGRMIHYEIIVKCTNVEYKKQVSIGSDNKKPHEFLTGEAKKCASKAAVKHNISDLRSIEVNINRIDQETTKQPAISKGDRVFRR
jgi:hypothetical protein